MTKTLSTTAAIIAMTIAALLTAPSADAAVWKPCRYEDGSGQARCVWDGRHMGNGQGRSYIVRRTGDRLQHEQITYVSHRRAHQLLVGGAR